MHMRTQSKPICGLLLVIALLTAPHAEAHSPRAREVAAIIETINYDKRTLILNYPQGRGPHEVVWNKGTTFLRNGKLVTAAELKERTPATIYYKSPFFGKPFATKIVWSDKSEPETNK